MDELFIGLMSGTSMDGVDAALLSFSGEAQRLLDHRHLLWPESLRQELKALAHPGDNEIERLGSLDIRVAEHFNEAVQQLLRANSLPASAIRAIGSHGQTVRHLPLGDPPSTLQIGDPNLIAERSGITVVADFRRRDMAAGGEGAPIAPAYHAALFGDHSEEQVILNLGGIANITHLPVGESRQIIGFDTGPANTLMDAWIQNQLGRDLDENGEWAAGGQVIQTLLDDLLKDDYFQQPPPKSTGPERFNLKWLNRHLSSAGALDPQDIQATLTALTAETVARAVSSHTPGCRRLVACGGGVSNSELMRQLALRMSDVVVESSATYGIDPQAVESAAFAWLARRTLQGLAGNIPAVTGAAHPVILGGIYQA